MLLCLAPVRRSVHYDTLNRDTPWDTHYHDYRDLIAGVLRHE